MARACGLAVVVRGRRYPVADLAEVERMFCDAAVPTCSACGPEVAVVLERDGVPFAHVSYTGRVWAGPSAARLLYEITPRRTT